MEETFQLPNEVSYSSHVKSKTANSKLDQTKMTKSEYKKVSTLSTSSISRPSKITPDTIESDKLAKQATTLRRLKWISAFLAISTVINSATFGGLTHSLVSFLSNKIFSSRI